MRTVAQRETQEQPTKKAEGWLHVRVPREMYRKVKMHSAEDEISAAEIVTRALDEYFSKREAA